MDYEYFRADANGVVTPRWPFVLGLDLGQSVDPSALCVLERHGEGSTAEFHCRHLHRYPLGTSYPSIVKAVIQTCETEPLASSTVQLAIDQTGVGRPVCDLFLRAHIRAVITPITITGGDVPTYESGWRVPKRHLVSCVQAALQTGRLKFAAELEDLEVLKHELQNFQVKISESGHDTYDGRAGVHDDLVLSVALGVWLGSRPVYLRDSEFYI